MNVENVEFDLKHLDDQLETGGISLEEYLRGLYDLIGKVLKTGDDELITSVAVYLQPSQR